MALTLATTFRDDWTPQDFLTTIIEPVLCHLDAFSPAASQLLLGTAVHESLGLRHRRQMGGGPARSYFQMEGATHDDIWDNYLVYQASLKAKIEALLRPGNDKRYELEHNDNYAAGMARAHYRRVRAALPGHNDLDGQANYWKQYYNTPLGAGTPEKYKNDWNTHVSGALDYRTSC